MFFNPINILAGLSAVYKLNSSLVDSHNGNNGTAIGGTPTYVSGQVSDGCSFSNNDSKYISIPHSFNNSFKSSSGVLSDFTISFWLKPNVISVDNGIISKRNTNNSSASGNVEYIIGINSFASLICLFYNFTTPLSNFIRITSSYTFSTSIFYHITITFEKNLLPSNPFKIYVNGVVDSSASFLQTGSFNDFTTVSQPVCVGVNKDGLTDDFNGIIDELYMWKKRLNKSEVISVYNKGLSGQSII